MNLLLWTGGMTTEHVPVLRQIKGWGFDGVEVPMFDPDSADFKSLGRTLTDAGLRSTAVCVVPPSANPISDDAAVRQAAGDFLRKCLDACAAMGAETMAGPLCSPVGALVGRGRTDAEWQRAVEVLRPVAEHARSVGVALSIEFLNRFETYFLNCTADAARLVDEINVPGCGILYDTFHSHIEEKDVGAAIETGGKRINHVHISENDRSTPGTGLVHWPETFAALKRINYDGWFVIEAFGQALPELAAATCIWRKMFADAEQLATGGLRFIREARGQL